jgi:tetratricopeptide (TPR) repeat protein
MHAASPCTTVLLALSLALVLISTGRPCANAQADGKSATSLPTSETPSPAGYDAAIDLALAEFERGNFVEAREQFLRAHKIFPNARTLRALGKAEFELKSYADAVTHLELALGSSIRPLTSQQRIETQVLLERASRHLARYTFVTAPTDAELTLDGAPPVLDARHSLLLREGAYTLDVRADGYMPLQRNLQVTGGIDERLSLELTPLATELPAPVLPVEQEHTEARPLRRKWWLWTGLAAVVVAGAATAVVLSLQKPDPAEPSGGSTGVALNLSATQLARY